MQAAPAQALKKDGAGPYDILGGVEADRAVDLIVTCDARLFKQIDVATRDCCALRRACDGHRVTIDRADIDIRWTRKAAFDLTAPVVGVGSNVYPSCPSNWESVLGRRIVGRDGR